MPLVVEAELEHRLPGYKPNLSDNRVWIFILSNAQYDRYSIKERSSQNDNLQPTKGRKTGPMMFPAVAPKFCKKNVYPWCIILDRSSKKLRSTLPAVLVKTIDLAVLFQVYVQNFTERSDSDPIKWAISLTLSADEPGLLRDRFLRNHINVTTLNSSVIISSCLGSVRFLQYRFSVMEKILSRPFTLLT